MRVLGDGREARNGNQPNEVNMTRSDYTQIDSNRSDQ